jgi:hypothetical protein
MSQPFDRDEPPAGTTREPSLEELSAALEHHLRTNGTVPTGIVAWLRAEHGWSGRLMEVLAVLTDDGETMGYLAGGRRPDEVMTWLAIWAQTPLAVTEIRAIVAHGGWDPEPFVPVARAGLLDQLFTRPDGTPRLVKGERAGAWLSDAFALADEREIVAGVRTVIDEDRGG